MGVWVMSCWLQWLLATARGCSTLELGSTQNTAYCTCIAALPENLKYVGPCDFQKGALGILIIFRMGPRDLYDFQAITSGILLSVNHGLMILMGIHGMIIRASLEFPGSQDS